MYGFVLFQSIFVVIFLIELPRYHIITIFRIMNFTLHIFSVKLCDLSGISQ